MAVEGNDPSETPSQIGAGIDTGAVGGNAPLTSEGCSDPPKPEEGTQKTELSVPPVSTTAPKSDPPTPLIVKLEKGSRFDRLIDVGLPIFATVLSAIVVLWAGRDAASAARQGADATIRAGTTAAEAQYQLAQGEREAQAYTAFLQTEARFDTACAQVVDTLLRYRTVSDPDLLAAGKAELSLSLKEWTKNSFDLIGSHLAVRFADAADIDLLRAGLEKNEFDIKTYFDSLGDPLDVDNLKLPVRGTALDSISKLVSDQQAKVLEFTDTASRRLNSH